MSSRSLRVRSNGDGLVLGPLMVTADRLFGDTRASDVLPDGRFIGLMNGSGPESAQASQLRIVFRWFEELKQRVPVN
jgi:hypothetical protein